ncbi:MAG: hypothetical protein QXV22_00420 [Thermoplasmataceae archaeon]
MDDAGKTRVEPFVAGLSIVNLLFSLVMNVFSFTIFYVLIGAGYSIYIAATGITIGQIIVVLQSVPLGRLIDKGYSYILMVIGSLAYGIFIFLIWFVGQSAPAIAIIAIPIVIAMALATQNTFRTSMNSFVAKAVKISLIGSHYSRILTMEAVGSSIAMFFLILIKSLTSLSFSYLIFGVALILLSGSVLLLLYSENRSVLKMEMASKKRPTFREGLSLLRSKSGFVVPLYLTKICMAIGLYGFSYYFIISGQDIGIAPVYSLLVLGITLAASTAFGRVAEKVIDHYKSQGRIFVVFLSLMDVVSYGILFLSFIYHSPPLYFISVLAMIPAPMPVAGSLSYEVRIIGAENRGLFGSIQRTLVGIVLIFIGIPLAYLYTVSLIYPWMVIEIAAVAGLIATFMLPSQKRIEEMNPIKEAA